MDFKGLDLNLLIALDVLLQEKNITHTGERIHLSQSATSSALARLRSFFSDELLVQIGHKMVLTPLAEDLIKPKETHHWPSSLFRPSRLSVSLRVAALVRPLVEGSRHRDYG
jgi:hypothetical protein